jgi:vancomycin aglycone glucosyltransferase
MKVLLAPVGTYGDVGPLVSYGIELRRAGHEVCLCTTSEWSPLAERHGIPMLPLPTSVTRLLESNADVMGSPLRATPRLLRDLCHLSESMFDPLRAVAAGFDCIVGAGAQLAGVTVAEGVRRPYVHLVHAPSWYPSGRHTPPALPFQSTSTRVNTALWRLFTAAFHRATSGVVNRQRARFGLPPVTDVYESFRAVTVVCQDAALGPVPADCGAVRQVPYLEAPQVEGALPPELEAFLDAGPPAVFLGFGSMPERRTGVLDALHDVLRELGARAVFQVGTTASAPACDARTFVVRRRIPHALLFPRVRACIHHGGAGTTYSSARAGVPQILMPQLLDQFYWGQRVHDLGLGPRPLSFARPTRRALRDALASVLQERRFDHAARSTARLITPPGGSRLSALLGIHS